jgi:hypothetical protein
VLTVPSPMLIAGVPGFNDNSWSLPSPGSISRTGCQSKNFDSGKLFRIEQNGCRLERL